LLVHYISRLFPPSPPATHRALHPFPTRRSSDLRPHDPAPPAPCDTARSSRLRRPLGNPRRHRPRPSSRAPPCGRTHPRPVRRSRSEEHTSELQSRENLVCRLLLEKKNEENIDHN